MVLLGRFAVAVLSLLLGVMAFAAHPDAAHASTTTVSAATFTYDAQNIARADIHEVEAAGPARSTALSDPRDVSASTSVEVRGTSTTPTVTKNATEAAGGAVDDALAYATRAEKLDHIFVPKHNLDPLVQQLGSREAVVEQMLGGVKGLTPTSGTFEIPVAIGGQAVVVRGAVVDGVVKLGTAFTP